MRQVMRSTLVAVAAVVAMAGGVSAASAHSGHWIYVTGGKAIFEGSFITVCDTAVDGNRVRAHIQTVSGTYQTGWAPSQDCTREGHPSALQFRVCAENNGCSAWHDRY